MARPGSVAGDQWTQLQIAESAADVRAAEALLLGASRETAETLRHAPTVGIDQRLANKRDMGYAAMLARRTAERLFALAGGQSLYASDPLQRYYRDIAAATSHLALRWDISATPYGRTALGLAPPDGSY
jgi:alkylation response protein AidB-like acyl-CoA dehydrogenase